MSFGIRVLHTIYPPSRKSHKCQALPYCHRLNWWWSKRPVEAAFVSLLKGQPSVKPVLLVYAARKTQPNTPHTWTPCGVSKAETGTFAAVESKLVMLWLTVPLRKEVQRRLFHRCRLELRLLQHHWYRKLQNQMLSMHPLGKFHLKHRILFEGINCQGVKQPPKSVLPWGKLGLIEHLFLVATALGSSLTLQNKTARPCWKEASFETRG